MAICKGCGKKLNDNEKFCPSCGMDNVSEANITTSDLEGNIENGPPWYKFISLIIASAAIISLIIGIKKETYYFGRSGLYIDKPVFIAHLIVTVLSVLMAFTVFKIYRNKAYLNVFKKTIIISCIFLSVITVFLCIMAFAGGDNGTLFWRLRFAFLIISLSMILFMIVLGSSVGATNSSNSPSKTYTSKGLKSNGELFDGFIKIEDDMTGSITYIHPQMARAFIRPNVDFTIRFCKNDDISKFVVVLDFHYHYTGDWVFVEEIIFKTDNNRYNLKVDPKRDHYASVSSVNYTTKSHFDEDGIKSLVTKEQLQMFEDICTTESLKIRFNGKNTYEDFYYNGKPRKKLVDAYNAYIKAKESIYIENNQNEE